MAPWFIRFNNCVVDQDLDLDACNFGDISMLLSSDGIGWLHGHFFHNFPFIELY